MKNTDRPKCGCGNTQDSNGYCDGSHQNKKNKTCIKMQRKLKKPLIYKGFFIIVILLNFFL